MAFSYGPLKTAYLTLPPSSYGLWLCSLSRDLRLDIRHLPGNIVVYDYVDTDMLYMTLGDGVSTESEEVAPGMVLDFDGENRGMGIEIDEASTVMDLSRLEVVAWPGGHSSLDEIALCTIGAKNLEASHRRCCRCNSSSLMSTSSRNHRPCKK